MRVFFYILFVLLASSAIVYAAPKKKSKTLHGPAAVRCSYNRRIQCIEYGAKKHGMLLKKQIKAKGIMDKNKTLKTELKNKDTQIKTLKKNAEKYEVRIEVAEKKEKSFLKIQLLDKKTLEKKDKRIVTLEAENRDLRTGANVWYKHPAFWTCIGIAVGIGFTITMVNALRPATNSSGKALRTPVRRPSLKPSFVRLRKLPQVYRTILFQVR